MMVCQCGVWLVLCYDGGVSMWCVVGVVDVGVSIWCVVGVVL